MAIFEGTIKEFAKYLGAYAKLKVAFLASNYKRKIGKCEDCDSITKGLEAAHIKGKERVLLVSKILGEFLQDDVIKIDLNEFEERFIAAHQPIESTIRVLCKECHRKYDRVIKEIGENNKKDFTDEGALIQRLVNDQMNKSKAVKILNTKNLTSLTSSNTIFSNINAAQDIWWLEPNNDRFKSDLCIILNNDRDQKLHIFKITANIISDPTIYFIQRNDSFRTNCSDIYIPVSLTKFADKKFDFTKYLIETIEY